MKEHNNLIQFVTVNYSKEICFKLGEKYGNCHGQGANKLLVLAQYCAYVKLLVGTQFGLSGTKTCLRIARRPSEFCLLVEIIVLCLFLIKLVKCNFSIALSPKHEYQWYTVSVLGRDKEYTVKDNPWPEGVSEGKARGSF